jgi:hypothetical protein
LVLYQRLLQNVVFQSPSLISPFASLAIGDILTLCSTSSSASISPHGNGLLVLDDVVEERLRPLQLPAIDGLGGLPGVLEAHTQVGAARAGALRWVDLRRCVSNLQSLISLRSGDNEVVLEQFTIVLVAMLCGFQLLLVRYCYWGIF